MTALLDDPAEVERRLAMLGSSHVLALEPVRAGLLAAGEHVPFFDPLDGGAGARLLLLLETPGPGKGDGPRFASRDNRTPTGRNLRRFLGGAGIAREDAVIWNAVPWVVHEPGAKNRAVRRAELAEGLRRLPELLARLPGLEVAVLAGRSAEEAWPVLHAVRPEVEVLAMPHPSPVITCTSPLVEERIRATLARAAALLGPC